MDKSKEHVNYVNGNSPSRFGSRYRDSGFKNAEEAEVVYQSLIPRLNKILKRHGK